MPDNQEWERHWNTVCLGIVTVVSAAVGAALFTADLAKIGTSYLAWGLIALAMLAYLNVLSTGGRAIFSTPLRRVVRMASEAICPDDVVIVVAEERQMERVPADVPHRAVFDELPGSGTLGGIHTGIEAARNEWALVVACDLPFLSGSLLDYMAGLRDGVDAVVPVTGGRPEPTHALYSQRCVPAIAERL